MKKSAVAPVVKKRCEIEPGHPLIPIFRQCELVALSRSSFWYLPVGENEENLLLMRRIGVPRMTAWLRKEGWEVIPERMRRLMWVMGLEKIYPMLRLSVAGPDQTIYPYLFRGVTMDVPTRRGAPILAMSAWLMALFIWWVFMINQKYPE